MSASTGHPPSVQDNGTPAAEVEATDAARGSQAGFRAAVEWMQGADGFQVSLIAGTFLIVKVLMVAKGDVMTALAVVRASGTVAVIVGAILSALPIIAAVVLVVVLYGVGCGAWRWRGLRLVTALCWFIVLVACVLLTPWLVFLLASAGLIGGRLDRVRSQPRTDQSQADGHWWAQRALPLLLLCVLVIGPAWKDLVFTMWLPREELHLTTDQPIAQPGQQPSTRLVGYVLSDSEGWMSVLTSVHRQVIELKSDTVESRHLCRKNYHESVVELVRRRVFHSVNGPPQCID
jgi:hypothetical protein